MSVPCTRFETLLQAHGTPYYLKIDIESADLLCIRALRHFPERPRFVSFEISLTGFAEGWEGLAELQSLGYQHFKLVNQAMNERRRCPASPREGEFVDARFDGFTSGPFGEETPGEWLDMEELLRRYRAVLWEQSLFGGHGKLHGTLAQKIYSRLKRIIGGEPVGWFDVHAKLEK